MKYIIFEGTSEGHNTVFMPVIFPDEMNHKDVADALAHVRVHPEGPFAGWWVWPKPVSAGFFQITAIGEVVCHDGSESLQLRARPGDSEIVAAALSVSMYVGAKPRMKEVA